MTFANQVKNTLLQDISDMAQMPWLFSKHPETDFSGKRKLDFQSLIHFCICMKAGTIRHELLKYFAYDSGTLSNSVFHQQRNKLIPETFPFLFRQFNDHYPFSLHKEKYQLLACDGSSFTFTRNTKDCDTIVQPIRKKNEFQALADMIDRYYIADTVPIFIADRGFHSFNVFAHAIEHYTYFLIRAKAVNMRRLLGNDLPDEESFDVQIKRILTRSQSPKSICIRNSKINIVLSAKRSLLITLNTVLEKNTPFLCVFFILKYRTMVMKIS